MHPHLLAGVSRLLPSFLSHLACPGSPALAHHSWAVRRLHFLMQAARFPERSVARNPIPPHNSPYGSLQLRSKASILLGGQPQKAICKCKSFSAEPAFLSASVGHLVSQCKFLPHKATPPSHQADGSPPVSNGARATPHQKYVSSGQLSPAFELSKRAHSSSILGWLGWSQKASERQKKSAERSEPDTQSGKYRETEDEAGRHSQSEQGLSQSSQRKEDKFPSSAERRSATERLSAGPGRRSRSGRSVSQDPSLFEGRRAAKGTGRDAWKGGTAQGAAGSEEERRFEVLRWGSRQGHYDLDSRSPKKDVSQARARQRDVEMQRKRRWGEVDLDVVSEEDQQDLEQSNAQRPFQRLRKRRQGLRKRGKDSSVEGAAVTSNGLPAVSPHILQPHEHRLDDKQVPQAAWFVLRKLRDAGFESYLAGGMVRDLLLGNTPKDIDIVSTALPYQVRRAVPRTMVYGRRHPIAEVTVADTKVEVSSFETISSPKAFVGDTCHEEGTPAQRARASRERIKEQMRGQVAPAVRHLLDSALKRDVTINGLLYEPFSGVVYDFVGGTTDLNLRSIRTIIPAEESFVEDPARVLRAFRIAARTGFDFSKETQEAVTKLGRSALLSLSKERLVQELHIMLAYGSARRSVDLLWRFSLLEILLPQQAEYLTVKGHPRDGAPQRLELLLDLLGALDSLTSPDAPCHGGLWVALLALPLAAARMNASPVVMLTFAKLVRSHRGSERGFRDEHEEALSQLYSSLFQCEVHRLGRPVPEDSPFRKAVADQLKQWTLDSVPRGVSRKHLMTCHQAAVRQLAELGNEVVRQMTMSHVRLIQRLTGLRAPRDLTAVTRAHATRASVLFSLVAKRSLPEVVEYLDLLEQARKRRMRQQMLIVVPSKDAHELHLKAGRPTELADALEIIVGKAVAPTFHYKGNVPAPLQAKYLRIQANLEKLVSAPSAV